MTRGIRVGLLALAPVVAGAQGPDGARPISLPEAVRLAQQNSPTTIAARNQLRTGESSVKQQLLGYLPRPSLGTSANNRSGQQLIGGVPIPQTGNPWSYGRTFNLGSITLFDGGTRWSNYRQAQANLAASEAGEVTARYSVALSVKTQYYNVLAARESEAAARRQLEQADQQLKVSTAKMNAGAATRSDSLTSAIAVGSARLAILNAQNNLRNANAALTRFVGTPFTVTAEPADSGAVVNIDIDEASLMSMVLDGPAVRQSSAQVNAAQATHRAARGSYFPTLSMSGSYSMNPQTSESFNWGSGPTALSRNIGFNLNWSLFDGYSREAAMVSTRVSAENAEANYRDAKLLAQQNLTQQLNTFRTAMQQIELQQLQIRAAEENLRVVTQQYSLATKQVLDLLTAQASLDNARVGLITARQTARIAKANIEQLIGRDLP